MNKPPPVPPPAVPGKLTKIFGRKEKSAAEDEAVSDEYFNGRQQPSTDRDKPSIKFDAKKDAVPKEYANERQRRPPAVPVKPLKFIDDQKNAASGCERYPNGRQQRAPASKTDDLRRVGVVVTPSEYLEPRASSVEERTESTTDDVTKIRDVTEVDDVNKVEVFSITVLL